MIGSVAVHVEGQEVYYVDLDTVDLDDQFFASLRRRIEHAFTPLAHPCTPSEDR